MDVFALLSIALIGRILLQAHNDRCSDDPVRRNYPVIYALAQRVRRLSPFLLRYVYGNDRSNPIDPDQVRYIHHASLEEPDTQALGVPASTERRQFRINNALLPFPSEHMHSQPLLIGKHSRFPYLACRRIYISGMGAGTLSLGANLALSQGALKSHVLFNNGEAGLFPGCLDSHADIVFQIGVAGFLCKDVHGRFSENMFRWLGHFPQIKMFEVKLSQGAKPGTSGGTVPAFSVTPELAIARGIMPFKDFTAPSIFPEIQSEHGLLDFIAMIKRCTGKPAGFKICFSTDSNIEQLFLLMSERKNTGRISELPDFITLDGAEGGTTGGPAYMMRSAGAPLRESLPQLIRQLTRHNLRDDILVFASGQLSTPERAAWAFAYGADMIGVARGFMIAMGCIQAQKCNTDKCPSGIAKRDHARRHQIHSSKPEFKSEKIAYYAQTLESDLLDIARICGVSCYSKLTPEHVQIVDTPVFHADIPVRQHNSA